MPTLRRTLSSREQRKYEAELRWLQKAGLDIKVPPSEATRPDLEVCIGFAPNFCNAIFELNSSWLLVVTGVRIVARRSNIRLLDELWIQLPGEEYITFDLWPGDHKTGEYRIGNVCLDGYAIVNQQLASGLPLRVGKPLEGLLIAGAFEAKLPKSYVPGTAVEISVTFSDTLDRFYTAEGEVTVNHPLGTCPRVAARRRSTLFGAENTDAYASEQATESPVQPPVPAGSILKVAGSGGRGPMNS